LSNGYIVYERRYEEEKKKDGAMPPKWTHCNFLVELIHDVFCWDMGITNNDDDGTKVSDSTTRRSSVYSTQQSVTSKQQLFEMFDISTRMV
jgi:hypothetical protein